MKKIKNCTATALQDSDIEDAEESENEKEKEGETFPTTHRQMISLLKKTWKNINIPVKEEDIIGKWFACIYGEKMKQTLFVAKAKMRFLLDVNGLTEGLMLECLKPNVGSTNILQSPPEHLPDIDKFLTENIIAGPLKVLPIKRKKVGSPVIPSLKKIV